MGLGLGSVEGGGAADGGDGGSSFLMGESGESKKGEMEGPTGMCMGSQRLQHSDAAIVLDSYN